MSRQSEKNGELRDEPWVVAGGRDGCGKWNLPRASGEAPTRTAGKVPQGHALKAKRGECLKEEVVKLSHAAEIR